MHIRLKTKRRLLVLLAVIGVTVALLMAVYLMSRHRDAVALRTLRAEAMSAYHAGDYEKSVRLLNDYLEKSAPDIDPEAQFAFAKSRSNVPLQLGRHLAEGIRAFKTYLETMKPDDPAAQHELLKLYVQASYNAEAVHLADDILAKNPKDSEVLWQKVWAEYGQHRSDQALAACQKLNEVEPLNLPAQRETLILMGQTNVPPEQVIAHAEALRQVHAGDPRFEVLLADAYSVGKQDAESKKWLQSAASRTPPDAQFVAAIVSSLDAAELYGDAAAYLKRAADVLADANVQHLLAQRLWQNQEISELESRLKGQDAKSASADGVLLGYRALALFSDNQPAEARAVIDAMSHRGDAASTAWAIALAAKFASPPLTPTQAVTKLVQAVGRDPQNPVLHLFLAEAYLQTGESDLTIQECDQTFQRARSWAMPHVIAVQALLLSGRNGDAVATGREAVKRAPGHYDSETALAKANFALACELGLSGSYASLIPEFEQIQKTWHDPQTLWMYVTVLARSGKSDEAVAVIKNALAADPPPSTTVLTSLAEAAEAEHLDVGQSILDVAKKARGLTPEIAYVQARALLQSGKADEGFDILTDGSKGHENDLAWRIVIADYREMWRPAEALKDWIALGDQNPADLRLQQTILRANSRLNDRAFWSRTIDRLKALTGDQGLLWRIERGRYLLAADPSERDKAEAVNLLTQVTHIAPGLAEPHRLLAIAMEKVANPAGAIGELTVAADARPGDPAITRELVRLLLAANRGTEAQTYLDKLAHNPRLPQDARRWLVHMYVDQGNNNKALALLEDQPAAGVDDPERISMLAELYRRVGRGDEAAKLYASMLNKPLTNAAFCTGAADFFASRQDMITADKFLERLAEFPLKPGELEIDRAEFDEQWIGLDEAYKEYQAAAKAAPQSVAVWGRLVGFYLRQNRFNDAAAAAEQGMKVVPGNPALQSLHAAALTLASLGGAQDVQPLVELLCQNPQDAGATEMLTAMTAAATAKLSPEATVQKLREIADRHSDNIALQGQVIQNYLLAGQNTDALALARRAAAANPNSAVPYRFMADIYASAGEWAKAEQAVLLWREHSMEHPKAADLTMAEIYLREPKKNAAGAVRALASYVSHDAPARDPMMLSLYVKALVLADRPDDAGALLKPLLADSPHWRAVWLELAGLQKDAAKATKWIEQIADLIPPDAIGERVSLANAWYSVGAEFDSAAALETAGQIIQPLLDGNHDPQAWMVAAEIAHMRGDLASAEKSYRQVLTIDPQSVGAKNNLAYILWLQGRDENLPEARKLAESAVAARPGDASFHDTLARIEVRTGDTKAAIDNFRLALHIDPTSVEAMIGLADLLARDPDTRGQARDLIAQIQRLIDVNPHLPTVLRQQYQSTRDAVASPL